MSRQTLCILGLVVAGCKASWDLEASAPCDHAGFAIASRIHACTGDAAAANAAYERFAKQQTCVLEGKQAAPKNFKCSVEIAAVDCKTTKAFGDDIDAWLAIEPCPALFEEPESGTADTDTDLAADTGVSR